MLNTAEIKQHFRKMNQERCSFCTKLIQDFEDEMTVEHIKTKRDYGSRIKSGLRIPEVYWIDLQDKSPDNKFRTIIEQIQKTAQKILYFVFHSRTK